MAVISTTEFKVEEAVLAALAVNADLNALGVTRQRAFEGSADVTYPVITVGATSSHPQTYAGAVGMEDSLCEIICFTSRRDDPDTSKVNELLGACRDTVRDASFKAQLNGIVNFTVFGTNEIDFSRVADTNRVRVRGLTIRLLCNVSDI